ncbi:MAG TPA: glycosyltransferase [Polyangiales bacterium]|nr:glycosyltransferase [Polyangiales bacterium]
MLSHSTCSLVAPQSSHDSGACQRIGILNDYIRIPFANGSSFASQFLRREFVRRGPQVSVIGPADPQASAIELPDDCIELASGPLRTHPGVRVALPTPAALREVVARELDIVLGQSGNELIDLGIWLRAKHAVPFLAVNTMHLPSYYHVILPDWARQTHAVTSLFEDQIIPRLEQHAARVYNQGDGLIVLSRGLERYWREHGVRVPIHVIPRAVDHSIFGVSHSADPFDARTQLGQRLLCVCRHSREKDVSRMLEIFAHYIAPNLAQATLTLVGDGPDHAEFIAEAERLGVADRVFFPGEVPLHQIAAYYRHADLFVYTSRSETYGQVVSEALYCGLPVVAFHDGKGVSDQVSSGSDGVLVPSAGAYEHANWRFGAEVVALLHSAHTRHTFAANARKNARMRCDAERCVARYYDTFDAARKHCTSTYKQVSAAESLRPLVRWASMHSALIGLGLLRPPAAIKQLGRTQAKLGWRTANAAELRAQ